jgi:hypothetical protein
MESFEVDTRIYMVSLNIKARITITSLPTYLQRISAIYPAFR